MKEDQKRGAEQTGKLANKQSNDKRMPSGKGRPKAFQPQFGKFYYDNKRTTRAGGE